MFTKTNLKTALIALAVVAASKRIEPLRKIVHGN
jgi:hypothetical protein